jgi:hypothetical protein
MEILTRGNAIAHINTAIASIAIAIAHSLNVSACIEIVSHQSINVTADIENGVATEAMRSSALAGERVTVRLQLSAIPVTGRIFRRWVCL